MLRKNLMAFLYANKGRGAGFSVQAEGDEPELLIYDFIVSSDADAYWMGGVSAETFARTLATINAPRVHVRINSPGGDAFAGISMANAIRAYPGEVVVHVDGYAASAAGHLCAATSRVVMGLGAMIMVHEGWTISYGNKRDMRATADLLDKLDAQQIALFQQKNPDYDWQAALEAETWFDADEAIAIGLASEKVDARPNGAKAMAFDFSAYKRAPAAPAADAPAATVAALSAAPEPAAKPSPTATDTRKDIERRLRVAQAVALQTA